MQKFRWSSEKEKKLQAETSRNGVTFADCVVAIADGRILDVRLTQQVPISASLSSTSKTTPTSFLS